MSQFSPSLDSIYRVRKGWVLQNFDVKSRFALKKKVLRLALRFNIAHAQRENLITAHAQYQTGVVNGQLSLSANPA